MSDSPIRVDRAADPGRFLATDQTVWFAEVSAASTEVLLTGLSESQRFAADVDGADPTTYPGVYGSSRSRSWRRVRTAASGRYPARD